MGRGSNACMGVEALVGLWTIYENRWHNPRLGPERHSTACSFGDAIKKKHVGVTERYLLPKLQGSESKQACCYYIIQNWCGIDSFKLDVQQRRPDGKTAEGVDQMQGER